MSKRGEDQDGMRPKDRGTAEPVLSAESKLQYDQSTVNKRPGLTWNQTAQAVIVCRLILYITFLAFYLPKE